MEKEKLRATPLEVELPRPDLRFNTATENTLLVKNGELPIYVLIVGRELSGFDGAEFRPSLGDRYPSHNMGPKTVTYTGPLTPELISNILIYG